MSTIPKIIIGALSVVILGVAGYFLIENIPDFKPKQIDTPEKIVADYDDLLARAEQMRMFMGDTCDNKKDVNKKIEALEKELADLGERKKEWLDNVPELPDIDLENIETENKGRPGTEVPELSSDVPPLPDINPEVLGSEVPELSSDVPPLPDVDIQVVDDFGNPVEYIPELPELNTGLPGSEIPELTPDYYIPELPEIDELDIVDPDEPIIKMAELEEKIKNILQELKAMCLDEENPKVISDKCEDACQKYSDCTHYTEDTTAVDWQDAYDSCMIECTNWSAKTKICINKKPIKTVADCTNLSLCALSEYGNVMER